MPSFMFSRGTFILLVAAVCLAYLPGKVAAFGAGNIPSIAQVSIKLKIIEVQYTDLGLGGRLQLATWRSVSPALARRDERS